MFGLFLFFVRIALSLVFGWLLLMLILVGGAHLFDVSGWSLFHSAWMLPSLLVTIPLAFWLLGFYSPLRLNQPSSFPPRSE